MKKILVFKNCKLGDFITSIPSLNLIKEKYPDDKIYFLSHKNNYKIFIPKIIENTKLVDSFIFFNKKGNSFLMYVNLIVKIRKLKFDQFYYLQENSSKLTKIRIIRDYLFFYLCNIKKMTGFQYENPNYKVKSHTLEIAQRVKKNISKKKLFEKIIISIKPELAHFKKKYIIFSIGGISSPAKWPISNWYSLTKLILDKYKNFKIILIGVKNENLIAEEITKQNPKKIINMCGKTNFNLLCNILKNSKLVITNDNGIMHLCSVYQKKIVALFNNHDPEGKWYPLNAKAQILRPFNGIQFLKPEKVFTTIIKNFKHL